MLREDRITIDEPGVRPAIAPFGRAASLAASFVRASLRRHAPPRRPMSPGAPLVRSAFRAVMLTGVCLPTFLLTGPSGARAEISAERLETNVRYLADDSMEGRGPGTAGLERAAEYIYRDLETIGLTPAFDGRWSQDFTDDAGNPIRNVGGIIEGSPGEQHLLIGAHYDHLGTKIDGGETLIFNGADDNASGVAALLELARYFAEAAEDGAAPGRTLVFVAFSGEEEGLLGSAYYGSHPALPVESLSAMVNLDTIGRLRDGRLVIFGGDTAEVFPSMIEGINRIFSLHLAINEEGIGAGDHETFFRRGVPVLHLFTDGHPDYHRTGDTMDRINYDGLTTVTEFAAEIIDYLSDPSVTISFVPAGAEKLSARPPDSGGRQRRASFGTIPDFSRESGGVLVTGVLPGSPAEQAGIQVGDLIVEIDGTPIDTLQDYQAILAAREPGDTMTVVFVRDGERQTVKATLIKRKMRS